jgi:uncharacterized membrane protein HdeD (DUF308 family)
LSTLDAFLGPLSEGVWEVTIPKEQVTEPLDAGWEKSPINVPSPGTIASYRKGRFHVHETKSEWKVHLDNHDPKIHPYLHLIDDAPLLLMIGDTFVTLIAGTRKKKGDTLEILANQERAWQQQVLLGVVTMLAGLFIILSPLLFFEGIFTLVLPLAIIAMGFLTLYHGLKRGKDNMRDREAMIRGAGIIIAGIVAGFLPVQLWALIILVVLAAWMFASAFFLIGRATKGRAAIPEGFFSRLAIAVISLVLAVLIFLEPLGVLILLMLFVGVIAMLLGIVLAINGLRLRERMVSG